MKSRKRGREASRLSAYTTAFVDCIRRGCKGVTRAVLDSLRPWRPDVCLDLDGSDARRLRRMLRRATRQYLRALRVTPPDALLLVVQRVVVQDGRELAGLLQVFEDADGCRRTVVLLALSVGGREVGEDELPAVLRHVLEDALAEQLGRVALSAPFEWPGATSAAVIPIRGTEEPPFQDAPPPDEEYAGYSDGFAVGAER